jgi:purine-binding chemotaxis protein CheW
MHPEPNREPGPKTDAGLLRARARELAREPDEILEVTDAFDVVEFELAGEIYGLELARVREVCTLKEITPVPCTPAFVVGIVNLRGEIQTVVDLRKFFDLPPAGITQLNQIILIDDGRMQLGILADAILRVRAVSARELQSSLPTLSGIRADYLRGVTGDRMAVLDAVKILSDQRIIIYEEMDA